MSRQKELVKNTALLAVGKISTQCISFFLLPLYTSMLETSEYGTFDLMITYGTLLLPLVNWQFDQGIFRFTLDCRGNREKQSVLFSTMFAASCIQCAVCILLLLTAKAIWKFNNLFFLTGYIVVHVFTALLLQFVRGLGNNKLYAASSFLSATSAIVLNVMMLAVFQAGLPGLLLATLLAQVVTIIYLCRKVRPWNYFSFSNIDKEVFRTVREYSIPLIPNNLAWWVVNVSDRTIISYVLGITFNGIYTVANKFSNVFIQFYNIFNLSWTETVSLHFEDSDRDLFFSDTITTLYKLFSCVCFMIVSCIPFAFPILVHDKYADAYAQIILLMYAMLMRVFVGLYSCVYIAMKDSKKVAETSIISAVVNLLINFVLISKIGLYAASVSTLISFGSMAVLRYIDVNRKVQMKIKRNVLLSSAIVAVLLMITYYRNDPLLNSMILLIVVFYSVIMNYGFLKSGYRLCLKILRK